MEQILTNNNDNDKCCEFEKMQLCRVALILQKKLIELKDAELRDKKGLCIRFPIWLWYRNGFDAVTCRDVDIKIEDVEKFSLEWYNNYIILTIHGKNECVNESARFDNSALLTTFVCNIYVYPVLNIQLTKMEFPSKLLLPVESISKTIYEV